MTDEKKQEMPKEADGNLGWKPGDGAKAVWGAARDNPGHAIGGAIIGQVLIPIPVVGAVVGAGVASWWAKKNDPKQG